LSFQYRPTLIRESWSNDDYQESYYPRHAPFAGVHTNYTRFCERNRDRHSSPSPHTRARSS